ncbi:hypothetical protein GGR54DRAFT_450614 [Hypoxylon sp. NC1633]|nr:hypothetical protein GGR54DRAFT_450614 [Hypoxylon sp. NC1633]
MSIGFEMDDTIYVHTRPDQMRHSLSRDSNIPEDRQSVRSPSGSAYAHDIPTTYASVPPFGNYSVPYDSSLPTPVSVAGSSVTGSPSMNDRASKMLHSYNQHRASSQQHTPPNTSRPWSNYQMNAHCSQADSPIDLQSNTAELLEMHAMDAARSTGESAHIVSEPPPPFQWGQYTVSSTETTDDMAPHIVHPMYAGVAPMNLHSIPGQAHVPVIQHPPDPRDLPVSVTAIDGMHSNHYSQMGHHLQIPVELESYRRKPSRTSRNGRSGRPPKRPRAQSRALSKRNDMDYMESQKASSTVDDASPTAKVPNRNIELRPDAPEKDRFIVELRCQMDGDKGKGIWEEITKQYEKKYGKRRQESLQMNLTRAVLKYAIWPQSEDEALRNAVDEIDQRRYADIVKLMKEKFGGCQAWEWKEGHIRKRLVELGFEELDHEDITKKPRRKSKKAMARRSAKQQSWGHSAVTLSPYEEDNHTLTSEQENYILEHYCKPDPPIPNADAMHGIMDHSNTVPATGGTERDIGESQSERVAKQACDQLLSKRSDHLYGSHFP